jgi:putative ABC transport system permease protein
MESILKDLRFAARSLRRQPAFSLTVILTLALAIGASTAIFSMVEATLLRSLPFRTPDRIAFLWGVAGPQRAIRGASFIEVQDWAKLNRTFENVAVYDETSLNLQTADGAERVDAEMVSASYFPMLGANAALGRTFTADEDVVPDANPVVVISDGMWKTRFGADPRIVGRTLTLNDKPFTVLGVMQPDFKGISFDTDIWFPSAMVRANGGPTNLAERGNRWLGAVGRLRPGTTLELAQNDVDRVAAQLAKDFPQSNRDRGVQLSSLRDSYLGTTRSLVLAVFAAVGLLLLIACANVIGLQLVRASGRRQEIALRIAIGAERGRLIQQLVVEGLVLAVSAAAVGLLVAYWAVEGLTALAPDGLLPPYADPSLNVPTFLFTLLIALGCGLVFGLIPARRSGRVDLVDSLKQGARGSNSFGRGGRFGAQQMLVITETAVALMLLVGAGLFVRSLQRELAVSPGFDPRGVLRARVILPLRYTPVQRLQMSEQLRARLGSIPSVRAVAIGSDLPLGGGSNAGFIFVPDVDQSVRYYRHSVNPDFFAALRIQVLAGRGFTADDKDGTPAVVTVNQSMARRFWPNENPIGKHLRLGNDATAPEVTVVGVVADVRFRDLTTPLATTEPDVYFPMAQRPAGGLQIAIRSELSAESITGAVRRELAAIDPTVPLFGVRPMEAMLAQQTASGRFASSILGVFGVAALVLTAVGLYGVLAFVVSLRRREIGIRIALGASNRRVLEGVIGHGVRLVAFGLVIGLAGAAGATRWIAGQLFGVGAHDPLVFTVVPALLLGVAVVASWVPARRAARVDPQIALRSE